jgi:agmatinase
MKIPDFNPFAGSACQASSLKKAKAAILPLCYENAPSYGSGSRYGPLYILEASVQLEDFDEEAAVELEKLNLYTLKPIFPSDDPGLAIPEMKASAKKILSKNKFLLCLGGDHAISIGPIEAAAELYQNTGVLQIDAHLDLRDTWNGSRYNHACVMRRVIEDIGVPVVPVGIRSFSKEEADLIRQKKCSPFYAHDIVPWDNSWIQRVIDHLPENVYLTVDLDGLDPGIMPGTGTPEPGGLLYRQIIDLIRALGDRRNVIAADINELVKIENTQVSEYTAARIASKILIYCSNTNNS